MYNNGISPVHQGYRGNFRYQYSNGISPEHQGYRGNFRYQYSKEEDAFKFGGETISQSEALMRMAGMPHNEILTLKFLKQFSTRFTKSLRDQDTWKSKAHDPLKVADTIPNEAEVFSLWKMTGILNTIKEMETLLNENVDPNKIHATIGQIKQKLKEYKANKFSNLLPETALYNEMVTTLDDRYEEMLNNLIGRLEEFEGRYIEGADGNDCQSTSQATRLNRQSHYKYTLRYLLDGFEKMETAISVREKKGIDSAFVLRNKTNTNVVGAAKNDWQEHVFSTDNVFSDHLYIDSKPEAAINEDDNNLNNPNNTITVFDSANYNTLQNQTALFACNMIEQQQANDDGIDLKFMPEQQANDDEIDLEFDLESVRNAYKRHRKNITQQSIDKKNEISKIRHEYIKKHSWNPFRRFNAYWGLYHDSTVKDSLKASNTRLKNTKYRSQWEDALDREIRIALGVDIDEHLPSDSIILQNVNNIRAESPLYVYQPSDPLSATGYFTYEFGHYFSYRMGEAHPTLTLMTFLVPAGLFGTAGLATTGVAAHLMNKIVHAFSTALTMNGKFVMSAAKLQAYVNLIDKTWLSLTGGLDGSAIQVLLMCGFGLPKICYLIAESALGTIFTQQDASTMEQLAFDLSSESTEGHSHGDQRKEALKTTVQVVAALGVASGIGIIGSMLIKKGLMKFMLDTFDHVKKQPFQNLDKDIIDKVSKGRIAVDAVTLVLTMKTAAIFLGKIFGVTHFMHSKHLPHDVEESISYFLNISPKEIDDSKNTKIFQDHYKHLKGFKEFANLNEQQMVEMLAFAKNINPMGILEPYATVSKYLRKGHELEDYAALNYFERLRTDESHYEAVLKAKKEKQKKSDQKNVVSPDLVKEFNQHKYTMECMLYENPHLIDYFEKRRERYINNNINDDISDDNNDVILEENVLNEFDIRYTAKSWRTPFYRFGKFVGGGLFSLGKFLIWDFIIRHVLYTIFAGIFCTIGGLLGIKDAWPHAADAGKRFLITVGAVFLPFIYMISLAVRDNFGGENPWSSQWIFAINNNKLARLVTKTGIKVVLAVVNILMGMVWSPVKTILTSLWRGGLAMIFGTIGLVAKVLLSFVTIPWGCINRNKYNKNCKNYPEGLPVWKFVLNALADGIARPLASLILGSLSLAAAVVFVALSPVYAIISAVSWWYFDMLPFSLLYKKGFGKPFETEDGQELGFFDDIKKCVSFLAGRPLVLLDYLKSKIDSVESKDKYPQNMENKNDNYIKFDNFRHRCVDRAARFVRGGEEFGRWFTTKCKNGTKRLCERSLQHIDEVDRQRTWEDWMPSNDDSTYKKLSSSFGRGNDDSSIIYSNKKKVYSGIRTDSSSMNFDENNNINVLNDGQTGGAPRNDVFSSTPN
ncbi:MAG: hypothetical protein GY782_04200 [Gammaproteobacteria bacterium]|nr:hypothetical protein [Gammaproteobacteria bacterium]